MARRPPSGLGTRGKRLWREIATVRPTLSPGEAVQVEECCRIVDRLDHLDAALTTGDYLTTAVESDYDLSGQERQYRLVVNSALSEARQQANTLRLLLTSLGLEKAVGSGATAPASQPTGDPADELAAERERRRNAATTSG